MHLVTVKKKFDKCLLTGWSVAMFILLADIFNFTFNLFINNIVSEPFIDESLFYIFQFFIKYFWEEEIRFPRDVRLLIIAF